MATERTIGYRPGLVDLATGQISREIFVNEEIYAEEQERVFARSWLFVGHESQVPNPGDFFVSCMGEESVLLCRDRAGQVHVFLNSCRHRGMKVCRYDEGNTTVFTCPYHGWSYGTDGRLVGVPYFREAYHSKLDRAQWGLVEVAQLCVHKGAVWATWDKAAPPFLEYLGDFVFYLDQTLDSWDGSDGGTEILGGIQKWLVPSNWKFPAENFSGDSYHNISHRSVDLVGVGPSGSGRRDMPELQAARKLHIAMRDRGHQTTAYLLPREVSVPPGYQHSPVVSDYFRQCEDARRNRRGDWGRLITLVGEVFPSMAFLARQPRTIAVWHPARTAPDRSVALVPRRQKCAAGGQELPARLLHPLFRAGRHDRAGRHGELELRACRQPRHDRAALPLQLRAGVGLRGRELRVGRVPAARVGRRPDQGDLERAQSAQPLSPLGAVHGGRQLGRAGRLAPRRPGGGGVRVAASPQRVLRDGASRLLRMRRRL